MTNQQRLSLNEQAVEPVTITRAGITPLPEAVAAQQTVVSYPRRKKFRSARESLTLSGHTSSVTSVCLSADSRLALSGGFDGIVKLWDLQAGRSLGTFSGHTSWVNSVCLSYDGKLAISGSSDDTVKIWNTATGHCISTLKHQPSEVTSVCLSPDSRFALCGTDNGKLHLWDVVNGVHLRTLPSSGEAVPSGDAGGAGGEQPQPSCQLRGHSDEVTSVCLSYDGQFALSGSKDNTIILWEVATGKQLRTFTFAGHTWVVNSVCLSADGRLALSGSSDGSLHLWDLATGSATSFGSVANAEKSRPSIGNFKGHTSSVTSVSLSADGQFALSGSGDSTLKLWEVATGLCLYEFEGHSSWVNSVCLSPDAKFALSGSDDNTLKLWVLDWEEVELPQNDWDEGARPYLETFLTLHTPYAGTFPQDRSPTDEEITAALTHFGTPTWSAKDFGQFLLTLEQVGYGHLRASGVREQLIAMASGGRSALGDRSAMSKGKGEGRFAPPNEPLATAKVILTVVAGELKHKEYSFTERATCIIGRAKDCHILIPDSETHRTISRYHCLLDINPPLVRVRDFGSLNGTYINGVKIGQRPRHHNPNSLVLEEGEVANLSFQAMLLQDGDEIRVGNTVFRVNILPSPFQDSFIQPSSGDTLRGYTSYSESEVALKILRPQTVFHPSAIEQFLNQMANAQALRHLYLNPILDVGYRDGVFFIAYPLQGGSVEDFMQTQGGKLTPDFAVPIALQLLDALEYAHNAEVPYLKQSNQNFVPGRGWAHGDIEPRNILLTSIDGNPNHLEVKLSNYGVARSFDQAGLNSLSVTDPKLYSPYFLPRQQAINFQSNLPGADIWAVAACLYYMLTGTYPRNFDKKDPWLVVLQTHPVPVQKHIPSLPQPLADLIDIALVDYPRMRFTHPRAFKQALETIL